MLLFKTGLVRPDEVPGVGRDAAAAPARAGMAEGQASSPGRDGQHDVELNRSSQELGGWRRGRRTVPSVMLVTRCCPAGS